MSVRLSPLQTQKVFPMFLTFLKHLKAALLAAVIAAAGVVPSFALYTDPAVINGQKIIPERDCLQGQEVCYIRATINYNDNSIGNGVWAFTLPANAYVISMDAYVTTAFNAATTNVITIGATATGSDFAASGTIAPGTTGVQHLTSAAGLGLAATGNTAKQTAINGGVPVYFRYTQTGTAATAGVVTVIVMFANNNDK